MSKHKHSPSGAVMTELVLQIFRLNGLLLAAGDNLTRGLGLTSARWQVMGALADGPLTAAQIARNMGIKRQSVQRLVDVLQEQGILVLEDNPHHRRARLARLSETGQHEYQQICQIQVNWVNKVSRGLDANDIGTALDLLRDVEARLQQDSHPASKTR